MVLYFKYRHIKSFCYSYGLCFWNNIITTKNKNLQEVKALKQIEYFYFSCSLMGCQKQYIQPVLIIYLSYSSCEITHNFAKLKGA